MALHLLSAACNLILMLLLAMPQGGVAGWAEAGCRNRAFPNSVLHVWAIGDAQPHGDQESMQASHDSFAHRSLRA